MRPEPIGIGLPTTYAPATQVSSYASIHGALRNAARTEILTAWFLPNWRPPGGTNTPGSIRSAPFSKKALVLLAMYNVGHKTGFFHRANTAGGRAGAIPPGESDAAALWRVYKSCTRGDVIALAIGVNDQGFVGAIDAERPCVCAELDALNIALKWPQPCVSARQACAGAATAGRSSHHSAARAHGKQRIDTHLGGHDLVELVHMALPLLTHILPKAPHVAVLQKRPCADDRVLVTLEHGGGTNWAATPCSSLC